MEAFTLDTKAARDAGVATGMVIAAAIIVRVWGEEVQAAEILAAAGCTTIDDMRRFGVDAYDVMPLRNVMRDLNDRPRPLGRLSNDGLIRFEEGE